MICVGPHRPAVWARGVCATRQPAAGSFTPPATPLAPPRLGAQVTSLLKPVCATMAIVIYLLQTLDSRQQPASGFSSLMVYSEKKTDTAGAIAEGVLVNGLVMVRRTARFLLPAC